MAFFANLNYRVDKLFFGKQDTHVHKVLALVAIDKRESVAFEAKSIHMTNGQKISHSSRSQSMP